MFKFLSFSKKCNNDTLQDTYRPTKINDGPSLDYFLSKNHHDNILGDRTRNYNELPPYISRKDINSQGRKGNQSQDNLMFNETLGYPYKNVK